MDDDDDHANQQVLDAAQSNFAYKCGSATQFMSTQEQRAQLLDQVHGMEDEEFGTLKDQINNIQVNLNPKEYVERTIKYAEELFKQDRGHRDTKRANLGDIRSTRIRTPEILQKPIYDCPEDEKSTTYVSGNIKAIVPLFRERLTCDESGKGANINLVRFKRDKIEPISEKRIFGILTADQVGYVPNIKVNFTENSETFCQDTYKF